ncbi:LysR family transcriptional regulator [Peptococcus simiae]|uniref:LysR family transcriptional regulator n=1 Tax=Peptococcus simiae TaxID=1643805 RepID=A0ABW9GY56_9FIRM
MTIQQLRYFVAIVKAGSINKAADNLYISQPSLSAALREIEREVGCTLFTRTARGMALTPDGQSFLGYAHQVIEQMELLEARWLEDRPTRQQCAISTQHYAFVVNAFVNMVKATKTEEYAYTLREARTYELVEDVQELRSELGVLYLNSYNREVITRLLRERGLVFHPLFIAKPHIFIGKDNPLAQRESVTLADLEDYPRLSYEQGKENSFYFSEEILSTEFVKKDIYVGDRATIFNLMIGLNGYTIATGLVSADLNGDNIVAVPLEVEDEIEVGWIVRKDITMSRLAKRFVEELKNVVRGYGVEVLPDEVIG